jgi:nitrogen fixation NifU-like protein
MDELRELYQEMILDHSKRPRNFGPLAGAEREARGNNPLCGDRVTVFLAMGDGVVKDVRFVGSGCAISMASASMMTEMVKGKTEEEARALFARFHHLVTEEEGTEAAGGPDLDKLEVFAGVRAFPIRVKCATLPWHTLAAALERKTEEVTTE